MKNYLLIVLSAIMFIDSHAQIVSNKPIAKKVIVNQETFKTTLTKESILNYIKNLSKINKPSRTEFIKKIEANIEFDKMYMERRYKDQKFIIIPMKKVYFSQYANNQTSKPIQYLVVVEKDNAKGEIWRADVILIFPKDKSITVLPKNTFQDFAAEKNSQIDGVYTYLNLYFGDVKYAEIKVEQGKKKEFRSWNSKKSGTDDCHEWTLETTTINEDGSTTEKKENLGKTCTECPPGFKCDPIKK